MNLVCHATQSQGIKFRSHYAIESQLETTAPFERFPWLLEALRGLQQAYESGRIVPGIGDLRISLGTFNFVRHLLSLIAIPQLPVPRISPISGGGVGLVWNVAGKEAVLTVFPNEDRFAYILSNEMDELVSDGALTLEQPRSLNSLLNWLVER